jgi:uncharacterized protein
MKKIVLSFLFVLVAHVGFAQDAAFKADVLKLIKASGSTVAMESAKGQIMAMIPESKHAAFSKDFDATMPALYEKMAEIYMKEYTHADVKEMLKFYDSPVGKKMAEKAGVIYEASMLAGQEWGMGLQDMLMKYME